MKGVRLLLCWLLLAASLPVAAQSWALRGHGVGLYDASRDYDRALRVVQPQGPWNAADLLAAGAFASDSGPRTFCAWYQGPPTSTFTNRFGTPDLLYKVRVSGPGGRIDTFGPYGFSKPGFGVQFLNLSQPGTWRVEWFTVHRETHAERLVQTTQFQLNP